MSRELPIPRRFARLWHNPHGHGALAVGLVTMWLLLWQRIDPLTVLSGMLAAGIALRAAGVPAFRRGARLHPIRALAAIARFGVDLVMSSVTIGWYALRRPRDVRGAIVAAPVVTRSETVLAMIAADITLRPGTLVLDVDRNASVLYVHGVPIRDRGGADRLHDDVAATERRIVGAFGDEHPGSSNSSLESK